MLMHDAQYTIVKEAFQIFKMSMHIISYEIICHIIYIMLIRHLLLTFDMPFFLPTEVVLARCFWELKKKNLFKQLNLWWSLFHWPLGTS